MYDESGGTDDNEISRVDTHLVFEALDSATRIIPGRQIDGDGDD